MHRKIDWKRLTARSRRKPFNAMNVARKSTPRSANSNSRRNCEREAGRGEGLAARLLRAAGLLVARDCSIFRQRRRASGRRPFAGADVFRSTAFVVVRRDVIETGRLLEDLLQIRNAPAATRPRAAAFGELTRRLWLCLADKIDELAAADMKAITDLRVLVHE